MYTIIKKNDKTTIEKELTHEDMRNILKALNKFHEERPWYPNETLNKIRKIMNEGGKG